MKRFPSEKKWRKITKVEQLKFLLSTEEGRYMIEHTDKIGGHLTSGWKRCDI